ncbi:MAG: transglycosylase SLT domain-containing protein [Terriglobales bacterium]|jgi:membrane-bound lytic murein transglycosylase D|nr:transglycosylase SLT domain-containing protein [Terriglobales bacterium]
MEIRKVFVFIGLVFTLILANAGCSSRRQVTAQPPVERNPAPLTAQAPAAAKAPPQLKPAPAIVPPPAPVAKPDPVADVIAASEKEYAAGQENLKAGNADAAKANFDRALTILAEGTGQAVEDAQPDPRLQEESVRIHQALNDLNLQTAKPAEAAPEQKAEPAPIDEANEVTPPVDPNIKAQAAAEIKATHSDLPLMLTDPVAGYINYFSNRGRGTLEHALVRSGRYQEMIRKTLKDEGVPQDLIYLAQAESGFHPLALSRVGARGIWQFMASRGKGYGLERNMWVDDRQDPEKATRAAARHLKDLYNQFGDWYLAMAAYNSGPGTVQSAVKRTGYADFWELYKRNVLPKETRNYVPIILAETIMAKNPAQYGLEGLIPDKPVPYDTVKVNYAVDLRLVAECVNVPPAVLEDLNPSLIRLVTPKDQEFALKLPVGTESQYLDAINAIPKDMRVWWRYHTVTPGEDLLSIARAYHTTGRAIAKANNLETGENPTVEAKLIIPITPARHAAGEGVQAYAKHLTVYRIRRGDTVQSVADNFGLSPAVVRRWNRLKGNGLQGRRILYVHLPVSPSPTEASSKPMNHKTLSKPEKIRQVRHAVKPGETLYSIANSYNTTVEAIKESNRNVATLRPGMILLIRRND